MASLGTESIAQKIGKNYLLLKLNSFYCKVSRQKSFDEVMVAMRIKGSTASKKAAVATTTEASIAQQTAAFLKDGGAIQKIPVGVSGLYQTGSFQSSNEAQKAAAKKR